MNGNMIFFKRKCSFMYKHEKAMFISCAMLIHIDCKNYELRSVIYIFKVHAISEICSSINPFQWNTLQFKMQFLVFLRMNLSVGKRRECRAIWPPLTWDLCRNQPLISNNSSSNDKSSSNCGSTSSSSSCNSSSCNSRASSAPPSLL